VFAMERVAQLTTTLTLKPAAASALRATAAKKFSTIRLASASVRPRVAANSS